MSGATDLHLYPKMPGPVAARYYASRARVAGIMGPLGAGKSSTSALKHLALGTEAHRSPLDGLRRYRVGFVRDTYRQLWTTFIPTWQTWVPPSLGVWLGATDGPASHAIQCPMADGGTVLFEAHFLAIGDYKAEDVLGGYEFTAIHLNELPTLSRDVFTYARGRTGRWPPMRHGGPAWEGITTDLNAPDVDDWTYELLFENCPAEFEVFVQPGGLDPAAENLENLPADYYRNKMARQPQWWIDRFIHNKFAASRAGMPVYPEYVDPRHCAPAPLLAIKGVPLRLGIDAGGQPAAVALQRPLQQWRQLRELVSEPGTGARRFSGDLNRMLKEHFDGLEREDIEAFVDPSAFYGADKVAGEDDWVRIVRNETGLQIRAAPTNKGLPRREVVRTALTRTVDGGAPGFLLSPACRVTRKGFNSGYRLRRVQVPGEPRFTELPEKNEYSHPHDALQYALLGGDEYAAVMGRKRAAAAIAGRPRVVTQADYEAGRR